MTKLLVVFFVLAVMISATNAIGDDGNVVNYQQMIQEHNEAYDNETNSFRMKFIPSAKKLLTALASLPFYYGDLMFENLFGRDIKKYAVKSGEETAPESVDWRDRGAVTPVKDQGDCASCWAFALTGLLEAYYKNKTGELVELSQQYLVDCSKYPLEVELFRQKCEGNYPRKAMRFVKENGMVRDADYPYTGIGADCDKTKRPTELHKINEIMYIKNDERAMKEALHRYGPLFSEVRATTWFILYGEGVFSETYKFFSGRHAVLIVGYGTDPQHGPYWIIKNSWNTTWGEAGYGRVTRDRKKDCGLSKTAYFIR